MKDKLEKFIDEQRPSFDDLRPNAEIFAKIQSRIKDQKKATKVVSIKQWISLAAAACFVGVVFSMFYLKNENVANEGVVVESGSVSQNIDSNSNNGLLKLDTNGRNNDGEALLTDLEENEINSVDNSINRKVASETKSNNSPQLKTLVSLGTKSKAVAKLADNSKLQKQSFFNAIYNMESASTRLNAATVASSGDKMDKDIINALFNSMTNDPNTNVRMAALESLAYFGYEKEVKKKLIEGLKSQNDPVIKIALIQYLTTIRATSIRPDLQKMASDEATPKYLKDQVYNSLMRLEL